MNWREERCYMLAESVQFKPVPAQTPALGPTAAPSGVLAVSGYLRGTRPLSANQLVHITGYGDYQVCSPARHPH